MFNHNWLTLPVALMWLLICCCQHSTTNGQSQNAIGAHRRFEKTSFSCVGRPAGYYADIETGCQVYHMCDGLGRQFSYSCPNTTLFQQRMLICDHWYMVNCSKSESNYKANLLIGQRDKPFVNDEETNLRTPRPDLLDRPYAPDYSGESFRTQYKQFSSPHNQIIDDNALKEKQAQASQLAPGQQRWKIPPPSRTILPPAYEPQVEEDKGPAITSAVRFVPTTTKSPTRASSKRAKSKSTTTTTAAVASRRQSFQGYSNAALHQRPQMAVPGESDDLGTSHSTRYNTSADYNSAEAAARKERKQFAASAAVSSYTPTTTISTTTSTTTTTKQPKTTAHPTSITTKIPVKVPSKIYEPPYVYPIYNLDDKPSTETPLRVSSATPFTAAPSTRWSTTTTTSRPPSRPTTLAGKPFKAASTASPTAASLSGGRNQNQLVPAKYHQSQRYDTQKFTAKDARTPTPAQGFKPPTPRPPPNSVKTLKSPKTGSKPEASALDYKVPSTPFDGSPLSGVAAKPVSPAKQLLPPFHEYVVHDTATTQGPPIYYEWKVPSNGLEPPKLDPPIGVDGREYPAATGDYTVVSGAGSVPGDVATFGIDQQKTSASHRNTFSSNPFLVHGKSAAQDVSTARTPVLRSIKETGQPNSVSKRKSPGGGRKTTTASPSASSAPTDITQLRKDLSVPEYLFPLEDIGRTGYLAVDSYNSFQLKIPERRTDADDHHQRWFGENPKCPECHPSYVVPGTCAPCLKR